MCRNGRNRDDETGQLTDDVICACDLWERKHIGGVLVTVPAGGQKLRNSVLKKSVEYISRKGKKFFVEMSNFSGCYFLV